MASRHRPRPSTTMTKNGRTLEQQQSTKMLQIKNNGRESEAVASEVIELKEQKPIQPPPPPIAVNESRYVPIGYYVCAQCLKLKCIVIVVCREF